MAGLPNYPTETATAKIALEPVMNFRTRVEIGVGLILVALALFAWSSGDATAFLHLRQAAGWLRSPPQPETARVIQVVGWLSLLGGCLMLAPPAWFRPLEKTRHTDRH